MQKTLTTEQKSLRQEPSWKRRAKQARTQCLGSQQEHLLSWTGQLRQNKDHRREKLLLHALTRHNQTVKPRKTWPAAGDRRPQHGAPLMVCAPSADARSSKRERTWWQRAATRPKWGLDPGTRKRKTDQRKSRLGQGQQNLGGKTLRGEPKPARREQAPWLPLARSRERNWSLFRTHPQKK
jgi:hypothetical protein